MKCLFCISKKKGLLTYYRLRWLGKVSRMQDDRLPIRLFGRFSGQIPVGHPPKTWLDYARQDLWHLSDTYETGCHDQVVAFVSSREGMNEHLQKVVELHT